MKNSLIILLIFFSAACDLGLNTFLAHLSTENDDALFNEFTNFSFGKSLIDLVLLSYLRFALACGTISYILASKSFGVQKLKKLKRISLNLSICLCVILAIKLLYYAEDSKEKLENNIAVRALFAVSAISNFFLYWQWLGLKKLKFQRIPAGSTKFRMHPENEEDSEQTESLLSPSGSETSSEASSEAENCNDEQKNELTGGSIVWKLLKYSRPDAFYIFLGLIFLLTATICEIFLPYIFGQLINGVAIIKSDKVFKKYIVLMTMVAVGASVAAAFRAATFSYVMARFTVRIQNHLFAQIMKQEIGFFDKKKTGAIISRLTSDTAKMGDQISLNINVFLRSIVRIMGIAVFMAKLSWKITIVTVVGTPILAMVAEAYGAYYEKISKKVQDSLASANEDAQEAIGSIRTVRSFAAEDIEVERYKLKLHDVFKLKIKEAIASGGFHMTTEMCFLAMECLVLFYGGHLVIRGDLSGGNLVSFSFYCFELSGSIEEISDVYTSLMEAVGASRKVFKYLEREPTILNDGVLKPHDFKGSIEFRNVTFGYPSRPDVPVLENVSFKVNPGEIVALVGPSGGGKSTIVKLLEHFYEPQFGDVLIDDRPVNDYDHKYICNKVSLVAQEPTLFARSINENICYGKGGINQDIIEKAAENANAHTFISEMPEGYETQTGEKGVQLSGGQKQRVAIARALIRNPAILILDEATSALDAESEFQVQEALNRNLSGKTVVIIAHRLSTIEKANKILVVDKGHLMEQGSHSELMKKGGMFAKLMEKQFLGRDNGEDQALDDDNGGSSVSSLSGSESSTSSDSGSPPKSLHTAGSLPKVGFSRKLDHH
eukprot:gene7359-8179_t